MSLSKVSNIFIRRFACTFKIKILFFLDFLATDEILFYLQITSVSNHNDDIGIYFFSLEKWTYKTFLHTTYRPRLQPILNHMVSGLRLIGRGAEGIACSLTRRRRVGQRRRGTRGGEKFIGQEERLPFVLGSANVSR